MPKGRKPDKHGDCPHCKSSHYRVVEFPRGVVWHCPNCKFTKMDPISDTYYLALRRSWSKYCVSNGRVIS